MKKVGILLLLFAFFILTIFNKHSKDDYRSYRSVLWADASGYYIYNPMWFIYGNNSTGMADGIEARTGTGFSFSQEKKIITKYTSGVAILQAPFFLAAHLLSGPFGFASDGFSPIYHRSIMVAGAFYGLLGLLFSFLFLNTFFTEKISLITVSAFFLGTNLFYYTLDASGFLHVYSFFLISMIAFFSTRVYQDPRLKYILPLCLAFSLALLIRPTNLILLPFILFTSSTTAATLHKHNSRWLFLTKNLRTIIISILISLIVFVPQMIYWSQSFGNPVVYSYGNEGFSFLTSPKLLLVWFSTNNGLFTWAPLLLLSVAGMLLSFFKKNHNGIIIAAIFLISSYLFASWWNYWFGCAMGARSFVEYYPLLMFPFALTISLINSMPGKILAFVFIAACIWININIIYYYDGCFYGGEWDWEAYFRLLTD